MNKEFEKQYRDYIAEQVPDMWDRIEAGLKERSVVEKNMTEVFDRRKSVEPIKAEEKDDRWKHKAVTVLIPAVAAVFLCLFVPVSLLGNRNKSGGDSMNASPAAFEEEEQADHMEAAGSVDREVGVTDSDGMTTSDFAESVSEAKEFEAESIGMENSISDQTLHVRVRIKEIMEPADWEYDAIYVAEVLEILGEEKAQMDGPVLEGEEICFYTGADTDKTEGETPQMRREYEVILEPVPEEENYFAKKINFIP